MKPAGYLYKTIASVPDWLDDARVVHVESVSSCISPSFCDYTAQWRHNGLWLFDSPTLIEQIARDEGVDLSDLTLFYYECHETEFHEDEKAWHPLPELPYPLDVEIPLRKTLRGFDVATFSCGNAPECSPLSCNGLSRQVRINAHCLFATFAEAEDALNAGLFDNSEPGPFRILSVHTCR